jgi:pimeloyl-ACP methyl ester carboxylesterase
MQGATDSPGTAAAARRHALDVHPRPTEARRPDRDLKAPVILLTATKAEDDLQAISIEEHGRWAERMPNVRHILVEGAGHAIYRDEPGAILRALQDQLDPRRR